MVRNSGFCRIGVAVQIWFFLERRTSLVSVLRAEICLFGTVGELGFDLSCWGTGVGTRKWKMTDPMLLASSYMSEFSVGSGGLCYCGNVFALPSPGIFHFSSWVF